MAELAKWHEMKCECGCEFTFQVRTKRWHPTGGTSYGPEEDWCVECRKLIDPQKARDMHNYRRQLEETEKMAAALGLKDGTSREYTEPESQPTSPRSEDF